jgi:hypothetical protein
MNLHSSLSNECRCSMKVLRFLNRNPFLEKKALKNQRGIHSKNSLKF